MLFGGSIKHTKLLNEYIRCSTLCFQELATPPLTMSRAGKSTVSSNMWLDRQRKDPYVKRAVLETYRARSAFKLIEINNKYAFLNQGDLVIDIGACPGSWSQVAVQKTNANGVERNKPKGLVISVDREYILPIDGAQILSPCDITNKQTLIRIADVLGDRKATSVISDMAPNSTGHSTFDHDAIIELQRQAFNVAQKFLIPDAGVFLCKIWSGDSTKAFCSDLEQHFKFVRIVKPNASRKDSSEIFILASQAKLQAEHLKNKIGR